MLKKTIGRGALGFPLGICMGYVITIGISVVLATGEYHPCVPALAAEFESELAAVIFQAVLYGVLGTVFAAASVIWEVEKWSIVKQTGIYFLIASLAMLPIAYFAYWMEHSFTGFMLYFGIFIAIFVVVWVVQYLVWKNKIQRLNASIEERM
jgi:CDP-diglyceride synthetase